MRLWSRVGDFVTADLALVTDTAESYRAFAVAGSNAEQAYATSLATADYAHDTLESAPPRFAKNWLNNGYRPITSRIAVVAGTVLADEVGVTPVYEFTSSYDDGWQGGDVVTLNNYSRVETVFRGSVGAFTLVTTAMGVKVNATRLLRAAPRAGATGPIRTGQGAFGWGSPAPLVHLTDPSKVGAILNSGKVGSRWGIFALRSGQVPKGPVGRFLKTLAPGNLSGSVQVPASAAGAFRAPPRFGLFSRLRRVAGVRSTPLGSVNLRTGQFTANEIFRNGVLPQATRGEIWMYRGHQFLLDYGVDAGIYAIGGTAYVYGDQVIVFYFGGDDE